MQRVVLALACLAMAAGGVGGCGSTAGSPSGPGGHGGSAGSGVGGNAGSAASGGSDSGSSGSGGSDASGASGAPGGGASGASGASGGGASGDSGAPDASDAGIPDVVFSYDGPTDDGGFNPDASCAEVTAKAQLLPLDLYVVLDRSGSMVNPSLGSLRWPPVRDALNQFFQSPGAAGIGIALTMFAHPTSPECDASSYATPLVPMAPLPGGAAGQAITLLQTMNKYAPTIGIGTPTTAAVTGAVTFMKGDKTANPKHVVAIVLATDGLPGDAYCNPETAADVQAAVAAGFNGTPSVRTFVIGIDPDSTMQTNLTSWANAGGGQFFDVATSGGSAQFLQAMQTIQKSALGCSYNMPTTDAGIVDPDKVSVEYAPGGSGTPQSLPRVDNSGSCGSGWYYDDNAKPTTITLCKTTCDMVQANTNAEVDVNLGCLGS